MSRIKAQADRKATLPISVQAGVLAAAAASLWGALSFYRFETALQGLSQYRDPYRIGRQFERFSEFRQVVPESAILGYLTDAAAGSTIATILFDSAQYALAPRLLQMGATNEWVLGNFRRPLDSRSIGEKYGLHIERDFGAGVVLYRKQAP